MLDGTPIRPSNVFIADINLAAIKQGAELYGYQSVALSELENLPFEDGFFDIVFCSSVIEHVTLPKAEVWTLKSGKVFRHRALARQRLFADEIRRIGKLYYVQTPYRHFVIESHTWLPLVAWLPRRLLIPTLKVSNRIWVKRTSPDWYLLNRREMASLFPEAEIVSERSFGLTKSLMALRSPYAGTAASAPTSRLAA